MDHKYSEYQKILLNLKWFVKQMCRIFEEKLERHCSREHKKIWTTSMSMNEYNYDSPIHTDDDSSEVISTVSSTQSSPKHLTLTNLTQSLTNSPLLRRLTLFQQNKHSSPIKRIINCSLESKIKSSSASSSTGGSSSSISRLLMLKLSTNRYEREVSIRRFGEHLAVIYEYQIGMLNSLQAVTTVVNYIVDLLIKAIKKGILLGIDQSQLNPTILFDVSVIPKSGSKLVKTIGIGVHSNSLTWKVSNIFTHPGLRHNQVGGEDCTNLSIVTHLLTGFCPFGESRRPDIYGYRNLIVVPRRRTNNSNRIDNNGVNNKTDNNNNNNNSSSNKNEVTSSKNGSVPTEVHGVNKDNKPAAYEISLYDSSTINHARTNTTESTQVPSTNSLLDHIHKCYKSIFFVIFERPNVIEHLMTCQSFRVFCTKELITPIMFLTAYSDKTVASLHKSLFNNFDLFNICVTAQPKMNNSNNNNNNNNDNNRNDKSQIDKLNYNLKPTKTSDFIDSPVNNKTSDCSNVSLCSKEYDNFGFNI